MSQPWTTDQIPDLSNKVAVVTGANSGLGFEAARELARKDAQTVLACRNLDKAREALTQIQSQLSYARVEVIRLDLASLESVHEFAAAFKARYEHLDVLLNNAGIMAVPYSTTTDGFESQFGINHLGHFALTGLLLEPILNTPGARVVNVSSAAHRAGSMDFDNLLYEGGHGYDARRAYGRSKLANLLFTYELERCFKACGAEAIAVAAHPGGASTHLADHLVEKWPSRLLWPLIKLFMQGPAMGSLPSLRAAVDPHCRGGEYYGPGGFMQVGGYPVLVQSNDASHYRADARRLWQVSEELTGVYYNWETARQLLEKRTGGNAR